MKLEDRSHPQTLLELELELSLRAATGWSSHAWENAMGELG